MIHIVKLPEPKELKQDRSRQQQTGLGFDYSNLEADTKKAIRDQLIREQKGLCAYCMRRIRDDTMQIEHYIAQHDDDHNFRPELSVNYTNMLGVCQGGKGKGRFMFLTCDQHRQNKPLTVDPLDAAKIRSIKYRSNGEIYSENTNINYDLDQVLNLNCKESMLPTNRKAVLNTFQDKILQKYGKAHLDRADWEKELRLLQTLDRNGYYPPFIGILFSYVQDKIGSTE